MVLSKDQFPVVVQAYDIRDNKEFFVAEQIVHGQSDVDTFTARYAGKLIKARALSATEGNQHATKTHVKKSSSAGMIILIIVIILIALIVVGFYTGWIQRTFGINV
ncbi:MAG: hypothetical protein JWQ96_3425 [Segetibacter sp.]|nr:hypothetical protein [Segetibacter sp.]